MNCYKKQTNVLYFSSVEDISPIIWQQLACTDNLYFNPNYLSALAKNNPQIQCLYAVLTDDFQNAIAFATIQIVDFYLESVQNNLQNMVEKINHFGQKLKVISPQKPLKILTIGNTFVSGEHGIFIKQYQDKQTIIKELAKSVLQYVNSNKNLNKEISAFMLKDFVKQSLFITDELYRFKYNSFNVEPNMVLQIDKEWLTFEDYLASMKTKFRVKAKKALKQSLLIKVKEVTAKNIDFFLPKMTELYKKVSKNASFNLGNFNLNTYKALKENIGNNYFVKVYCINDKIVGFLSGMINQNSLDAHFVGIDYKLNREYAIYQRMLYDYIDMAITNKVSTLNFGRTASEIKSSVGAVPQDMTIYLRHKKSIPNKILSLFIKRIQPTEFHQKFPFKAKELM